MITGWRDLVAAVIVTSAMLFALQHFYGVNMIGPAVSSACRLATQ